jgi:hypothetical protein
MRQLFFGLALLLAVIPAVSLGSAVSHAEKLVDPNTVAPEYREVAVKRRAEQIKLFECSRKADQTKVLRRDRAAFISECVDK